MRNSNNNRINVPQARETMDRFKMQAAQLVGVKLTSRKSGFVGEQRCVP